MGEWTGLVSFLSTRSTCLSSGMEKHSLKSKVQHYVISCKQSPSRSFFSTHFLSLNHTTCINHNWELCSGAESWWKCYPSCRHAGIDQLFLIYLCPCWYHFWPYALLLLYNFFDNFYNFITISKLHLKFTVVIHFQLSVNFYLLLFFSLGETSNEKSFFFSFVW